MPGFKIKEQVGYNLSDAEIEVIEAITVLGDPGADRILFWDESANTYKFLTAGTGLTISGTTITSTGLANPMTTLGDVIYGGATGTATRLAGNTTTTKKFLRQTGDGTNSASPAWDTLIAGDIPDLSGTYEVLSNKSTDVALGTSDTLYVSQKAIKTYVDGKVAGLLDYRGGYDASGNTFPTTGGSGTAGAVLKGDMWVISTAGTLGGTAVQVGDSIIANIDTPAQTAANWNILNSNISYVPEDVANKVTSLSGASTDTQYPSAKLTYDQLALKAPLSSPTFTTSVTIPETAVASDTDKFVVLDSGVLKYRTGSQVLSDIGAAATNQTMYIGTTAVTINRTSAALTLAGLTLTTPNIGTPSAGTLTNCTGLPAAGVVAGTLASGMVASDHGTATTDQLVNVCYGTSETPPTASTTTIGTIYIQYTA